MLSSVALVRAQSIEIVNCHEVEGDETALRAARLDLNGNLTAALVFLTELDGIVVRGNVIGEPVREPGRVTVFLTEGTKMIQVFSDGNLPIDLDFTDFPALQNGLKGGITYSVEVKTLTDEAPPKTVEKGSNMLQFRADQPLRRLSVGGEEWKVSGTTAKKLMPFGEYDFTAESESGITRKGKAVVKNAFGSCVVNLRFND